MLPYIFSEFINAVLVSLSFKHDGLHDMLSMPYKIHWLVPNFITLPWYVPWKSVAFVSIIEIVNYNLILFHTISVSFTISRKVLPLACFVPTKAHYHVLNSLRYGRLSPFCIQRKDSSHLFNIYLFTLQIRACRCRYSILLNPLLPWRKLCPKVNRRAINTVVAHLQLKAFHSRMGQTRIPARKTQHL
jgi:hypothetical protein